MKCFEVHWDEKTGEFAPDIHTPATEGELKVLELAAARLLVAVAVNTARFAAVGCHAGCVFASIMEQAHKEFRTEDPEEYARITAAELLTPSIVAKKGH